MSVALKLGKWEARDGSVHSVLACFPGRLYPWIGEADWQAWSDSGHYGAVNNPKDLVRYLGPLDISPTSACADQAGTPAVSTVSTGTAGDTLRMMRAEYNALDRWLSAYRHLVAANERAKDDLEEAIKRLEKEVDL